MGIINGRNIMEQIKLDKNINDHRLSFVLKPVMTGVMILTIQKLL